LHVCSVLLLSHYSFLPSLPLKEELITALYNYLLLWHTLVTAAVPIENSLNNKILSNIFHSFGHIFSSPSEQTIVVGCPKSDRWNEQMAITENNDQSNYICHFNYCPNVINSQMNFRRHYSDELRFPPSVIYSGKAETSMGYLIKHLCMYTIKNLDSVIYIASKLTFSTYSRNEAFDAFS